MKKNTIIIALFALIGLSSAYAQEQRVARVHYAGSVIFQTPVQTLDSIKYTDDNYLTFYYSDHTWSRQVEILDSLTFAMSHEGDTTIISDTTTVDTVGMISIVWNGTTVAVTNPYPTDSINVTGDGAIALIVDRIRGRKTES